MDGYSHVAKIMLVIHEIYFHKIKFVSSSQNLKPTKYLCCTVAFIIVTMVELMFGGIFLCVESIAFRHGGIYTQYGHHYIVTDWSRTF